MVIIYSDHDFNLLKLFKCSERAKNANKRFEDQITQFDVLLAIKRFNRKCGYCSMSLSSKHWQLDHFYSRSAGGKNIHENLVPTCRWCNTMKSSLDGHAFVLKCEKVAANNLISEITNHGRK